MSDIVKRLRASVACNAVNGDAMERAVCGRQMFEASQHIVTLEAENARLRAIVERLPKCLVCGTPCVTHEDGGPKCEFAGGVWVCTHRCYDIECNRRIEAAKAALEAAEMENSQ